VFIQKTAGEFQFFLQAGAIRCRRSERRNLAAHSATSDFYSVVPQAFIKYAPNDSFSIMAGKLPTLIGAEYTFTFGEYEHRTRPALEPGKRCNPRRSRQLHVRPVAVAVSWGDGFYSNRYNWLTASLA